MLQGWRRAEVRPGEDDPGGRLEGERHIVPDAARLPVTQCVPEAVTRHGHTPAPSRYPLLSATARYGVDSGWGPPRIPDRSRRLAPAPRTRSGPAGGGRRESGTRTLDALPRCPIPR